MSLRKKTPAAIKKEARKMFESGMRMFDIAVQLKLNINTLYNLSSKEKWEKGILENLLYVKEQEHFADEVVALREPRKRKYRELIMGITDIIKQEQTNMKEGNIKLTLNQSVSIEKHIKALEIGYKLEKELYGIMTPKEEIDLETSRVKLEKLKQQLGIDESNGEGNEIELEY